MTGAELRRRRKALRGSNGGPMSMQEFATHAGVGWTTLQRYETQRPRTDLEQRGLDPLRVARVLEALRKIEST